MPKFKVYISDYDYPDIEIEKNILEPIGAEVIGLQCKTGEGLAEQAYDADAIIQQYAKITRETIEKLKKCKVIARYGIGVDIVDVEAAYENGIVVTNVPDYCLDEVADHAITLSFMLLRNIPFYNAKVHEGSYRWQDWRSPIPRMRDSVYGLIGFGRIAQNLARKIKVFGFDIVAYDPYVSESYMATMGVRKVDLDTLLRTSNVVNVLTPYTSETHHIINEEALKKMRKDAYLVGVSRGKCIDNKALYKALTEGWIVAAALDDPEEEPMKMGNWTPAMNPLFTLDNFFCTPHTAYVSVGSLNECRHVAANNVKAVLLGQTPPNLVKPGK
ncbi:Hydroxypyruvate reductase [Koleobacter methoxysyntrophicus]|jgi:D-3-phosphoglycerate dehydrogenase|uniref:Hydroxypyruvate reductase n=1 Tax=Koleobacter methoxysyntrophicus TaxID=2751313 RepID=A0A8A0RP37_9FIRM|nr:C-terminal binding protein [Koleobacter methoxysyntrophicus]MDI3540871.1 D-3-phosphoglycerate dehydrogenase / 2-oxoglutarate reductase [Thermosediminibacterales bacterium]MDK2901662.1 D-3-phosphoglycerate dehydrogenase / 2-oxoglutarate reductase [Thermosediminibacterales bacterium]NPV43896.1 C-terminal binding protein [Bacillota bacterium]QSQ09279.1 Hydroxypyruvate reductase [Koleobacter methoxysyntrophicus]